MIWSLFKRYFNIMHTNNPAHRIPWYLNTQKNSNQIQMDTVTGYNYLRPTGKWGQCLHWIREGLTFNIAHRFGYCHWPGGHQCNYPLNNSASVKRNHQTRVYAFRAPQHPKLSYRAAMSIGRENQVCLSQHKNNHDNSVLLTRDCGLSRECPGLSRGWWPSC